MFLIHYLILVNKRNIVPMRLPTSLLCKLQSNADLRKDAENAILKKERMEKVTSNRTRLHFPPLQF